MIIIWHYGMVDSTPGYYGPGFVFNWSGILGGGVVVQGPYCAAACEVYVPGAVACQVSCN